MSAGTTSVFANPVTTEHRQQYEQQGFCVIERAIPADVLEVLRAEADRIVEEADAQADREGRPRTNKYFMSAWQHSEVVREFMTGDLMATIARSFLGDDVYLSFEQFVVKAAEQGGAFAWHQDSGYVNTPHRPYLTCWCTLDDVTEENGTVYMLPYERAGTRDVVEHSRDEGDWDLIGYRGDDPGDAVIAPAGSIACFASTVFHRSGPNTTPQRRRVLLPQYSSEPILKADGSPYHLAVPLLKIGTQN
jgi:ectoine hydroxylase-related dioxygenase (phytanoyl-CoA dioxygenase family)